MIIHKFHFFENGRKLYYNIFHNCLLILQKLKPFKNIKEQRYCAIAAHWARSAASAPDRLTAVCAVEKTILCNHIFKIVCTPCTSKVDYVTEVSTNFNTATDRTNLVFCQLESFRQIPLKSFLHVVSHLDILNLFQ